jgi:hypothetical protein
VARANNKGAGADGEPPAGGQRVEDEAADAALAAETESGRLEPRRSHRSAVAAKPRRPVATEPIVTDMWSQERHMRSFAKYVLGFNRIGRARSRG